jgi:hypothetical protein
MKNSSLSKLCNTASALGVVLGAFALSPTACSSEDVPAADDVGGAGGASNDSGVDGAAAGAAGASGAAGAAGSDSVTHPPACDELVGLGDCGSNAVEASFRTPNMLVVIDKSGSMNDPFGGRSKWEAMKEALDAALSAAAERIAFGLELYPFPEDPSQPIPLNCGDQCCEHASSPNAINVPIEAGTTAVPKIKTALAATAPGGGTPTAVALQRAYEYFTEGAGASLDGDRYVLLATDGGPNCNAERECAAATCTAVMDGNCPDDKCCSLGTTQSHQQCLDDEATLAQIEALKSAGIATFVVGIPGTEAYRTYLNRFADAGGVPHQGGTDSYFAVDESGGATGLTTVFTEITRQLVRSCSIQLTKDPPRLDDINVAINCRVIPPSSPDGSGWQVDENTEPSTVVLSGPMCDWIKSTGAERVDILFGCPTVPPVH